MSIAFIHVGEHVQLGRAKQGIYCRCKLLYLIKIAPRNMIYFLFSCLQPGLLLRKNLAIVQDTQVKIVM